MTAEDVTAPVTAADVVVRPLRPGDEEAARAVAHAALSGVAARLDRDPESYPEDDASRDRARLRISRCRETDPGGAWAAERDGEVVGVGLALRRGPLWFLSLLAVADGLQGAGVGARLMAGCLGTYDGARGGLITVSRDPRAMRRYQLAGFQLEPALEATGAVDRSALPADLGVRDGDVARAQDLVCEVARGRRGADHGGDVEVMIGAGAHLLVAEDGRDRGFALIRPHSVLLLGATSDRLARRLLWAALAEGTEAREVQWLTARQQWALDVTLAARMSLRAGGSVAVRGEVGPLSPYLPSGAWG